MGKRDTTAPIHRHSRPIRCLLARPVAETANLTEFQFARLSEYPPETCWAIVVGMMIVLRRDGKPPDIIDQFGRDRKPLWREIS